MQVMFLKVFLTSEEGSAWFIKLNIALLEPDRLSTALYNSGIKTEHVIKHEAN